MPRCDTNTRNGLRDPENLMWYLVSNPANAGDGSSCFSFSLGRLPCFARLPSISMGRAMPALTQTPAERQSWHSRRRLTGRPDRLYPRSAHSRRVPHLPSPDSPPPNITASFGALVRYRQNLAGSALPLSPQQLVTLEFTCPISQLFLQETDPRSRFCSRRCLSASSASLRRLLRLSTTSRSR